MNVPKSTSGATEREETGQDEAAGWTGASTQEFGPGENDPAADAVILAEAQRSDEARYFRQHVEVCNVGCRKAEHLRPDQYCDIGFRLNEAVPKPARYRCRCPRCVERRAAMGLPAVLAVG